MLSSTLKQTIARSKSDISNPIHNQYNKLKQDSCFANTSRQQYPSWAFRISTNTNDLIYDSKYQLIKGKQDLRHKLPDRSQKISRQRQRQKKVQGLQSEINKHMKSTIRLKNQVFDKKQLKDQELIDPTQYKTFLMNNLQSRKQQQNQFVPKQAEIFNTPESNTIVSDINRRSSHHLRFQKQPKRPININSVIYNQDIQNNGNSLHPKLNSQKSSHDFRSYSSRKVFQPAQLLDKFYKIQGQSEKYHFKRSMSGVQFQKRADIQRLKIDPHQPPAFTRLFYNIKSGQKYTQANQKSYDMSKYKRRQLKFSRQVINPKRGCSR